METWRSRNKGAGLRHRHRRHSWPRSDWKRAKMFSKGLIRMIRRLHPWWLCHHRLPIIMANRRLKRSNICATLLWSNRAQTLMVQKAKQIRMEPHRQRDLSHLGAIQGSICKWVVSSVATPHKVQSLTQSMDSFPERSYHLSRKVWIQLALTIKVVISFSKKVLL